jgi:hypothetical protein
MRRNSQGSPQAVLITRSLTKELLERVTGYKCSWPLVNVLFVNRENDGVAEMVGVGFVHEEEWEAAQPEDIFLSIS